MVELLSRQQLRLGVVVAADGAGDPGEVLEALLPLGHLVVRAAQLGHLDFFGLNILLQHQYKTLQKDLSWVTLILNWLLVESPMVKVRVAVSPEVGLRSKYAWSPVFVCYLFVCCLFVCFLLPVFVPQM